MRDGGERLSGGRPATASGVAMYIAGSGSPHVADAQVGEIRGYARLPPPAGVAEMSASTIRLRRRGGGADTSLRPVLRVV